MITEDTSVETLNRNEDPITGEPGAHPVSTGVGAAGGGATGAVIGMAMGGPVGGIIGAVIGAVAGGVTGSTVGEAIDPTQENEAWNGEHAALRAEHADTVFDGDLVSAENAETVRLPSHEEVALRAWCYYEAEGKIDGRALEHWLRAERTLSREAVEAASEP